MTIRDFFQGRPMQVVGYGVMLWAIRLAVSTLLAAVGVTSAPMLSMLMLLALTASVCIFGVMGFRPVRAHFVREGLNMGLTWMLMGLGLDLGLYLEGFMKMPMAEYVTTIAFGYAVYPIILLAMGAALQNRFEALSKSINEATIRGLAEAAKEKDESAKK